MSDRDSWYIRSNTIIYGAASIGERLITGNGAQIQSCVIGDDAVIGSLAVIESGAILCDRVTVHTGAFVCSLTVVGNDVWIGPNVTILNTKYPHTATSARERIGVIIEDRARIGGGAVLLPGITIGHDALVGAGAVVTKDVAPHSIVIGNPARVMGDD